MNKVFVVIFAAVIMSVADTILWVSSIPCDRDHTI